MGSLRLVENLLLSAWHVRLFARSVILVPDGGAPQYTLPPR
jgi:hypothetical protein